MNRNSSKSVGFGIIGVGMAGTWYADIIRQQPDVVLLSALRSPGGDTAAIASAWGVPCFDNLETFLAQPGLDAVCIATPSGQHFVQARQALLAGKHVQVEKPLTLNLAEARELHSLAAAKNLRLGVSLQRRADPFYRSIKTIIDSGAMGKPVMLNISLPYFRSQAYYDSAAWRGSVELDGGGILMNQGIHIVDLAVWWLGRAKQVAAFTSTLARSIEVEDTAAVSIFFESGALGCISGTTAGAPGAAHSLELCSSEGSFRIEGEDIVRWDVNAERPAATVQKDGGASNPKATSTQNHALIVKDFITATREDRQPVVSALAASYSLELILAAYNSARIGQIISIKD
ncbi:MAG: Gfo/Idh/MocA family oxidoreductase [Spirochaetes bacterium]|nr:Gfo/Idh/MocA family oxidoreductase [Spirochaetota bacterium]